MTLKMMHNIEKMHQLGYTHNDIKPGNMVLSREDSTRFMLIDFGLAKKFRDSEGKHLPLRVANNF